MQTNIVSVVQLGADADGTLYLLAAGWPAWRALSDVFGELGTAPDMGRGKLAELWPSCPPELADKILAGVSIASAVLA